MIIVHIFNEENRMFGIYGNKGKVQYIKNLVSNHLQSLPVLVQSFKVSVDTMHIRILEVLKALQMQTTV